jgi:excisionase family DNA binding protein
VGVRASDAELSAVLDELVARVAEQVAARVLAGLPRASPPSGSPWLDAAEAADYLRCKLKRLYDLVGQSRLPVHRDGSRLLFHRDELDGYLNGADTLLTPSADVAPQSHSRGAGRISNPVVNGASRRREIAGNGSADR